MSTSRTSTSTGIWAVLLLPLLLACGEVAEDPPRENPNSHDWEETLEDDEFWWEIILAQPALPICAVKLAPLPDDSGFLILGRDGDVWHYEKPLEHFPLRSWPEGKEALHYRDVITKVRIEDTYAGMDLGTIGMALDPRFSENRFVYVWNCDKEDRFVGLERLCWEGTPKQIEASRTTVIRFSRRTPPKPYHMGGIVAFRDDGTLILTPGDAERMELAQDPGDLNGKILRIRPKHGPDGGYEVPEDNPFVGRPGYRPEIAALGVRAPFLGFLHEDHLIFADVGSHYEEINVWDCSAANFGWGTGPLSDGPSVSEGSTPPILHWLKKNRWALEAEDFDGGQRVSAGVGVVYEPSIDRYQGRLTGHLIFHDIMQGWIRSGLLTSDYKVPEHRHLAYHKNLAEMVIGGDGYIYGVAFAGPPQLLRLRLGNANTN